jgi:hypothetical protein
LGEITSAGRLSRVIRLASVKVLPLPVTPSRTVWGLPAPMIETRRSIASG